MKENFLFSLGEVLKHEGGYVNDPADPGGATNKGITQHVYDDWRAGEGLVKRGVQFINEYETGVIYKKLYWDSCCCDDLPSGLDYAVFDFAVNSGVNRASKYLQRAVAVAQDGEIGPFTIRAVATLPLMLLISRLCNLRQNFLEQLPTFKRFGKGWTQRVTDVQTKAEEMAA